MNQDNIEKWDWRYAFLKHYVNFSFRTYFKSLTVQGKENIPKNTPVIFAPNHQNALMDALAILYTTNDQPIFLARSDIFKKGIIAKILTFLKILPIYRIRDGYGNLKLNDYIINKIHDILAKDHYLVIFPEGNHGEKRQLRSLKKGIARIAFQTEESHDYSLGLKIVPVGLDYSNYYKFNERLLVNFGKPIDVSEFFDTYKENPSKGHLALIKRLSEELKKYMVHIEADEHYETINALREIYQDRMKEHMQLPNLKHPNKYRADKKLIEVCDKIHHENKEELDGLSQKVTEYQETLKNESIDDKQIKAGSASTVNLLLQSLFLVLSAPFFVYGWINNLLAYYPAEHFSRKMKDPQFISSIKYGISILSFPIFYLLQTLAVHLVFDHWAVTIAYLISLPLTGLFAHLYLRTIGYLKKAMRKNKLARKKPAVFQKMVHLRKEIINKVDAWVEKVGLTD